MNGGRAAWALVTTAVVTAGPALVAAGPGVPGRQVRADGVPGSRVTSSGCGGGYPHDHRHTHDLSYDLSYDLSHDLSRERAGAAPAAPGRRSTTTDLERTNRETAPDSASPLLC